MNENELRHKLITHFNISELRNLCFDLNINHESLSGDTIDDKARELVSYCSRHGLKNSLIEQCKVLRPWVSWENRPEIYTALSKTNNTDRFRELLVELQDVLRRLGLKQEHRNIGNQIANIDSGELRVLVSGQCSTGKSSLINALLGRELLPTNVTATTGVTTEIKWGDSERVMIHFGKRDNSPREIPIDGLEYFSSIDSRLFAGARNQDTAEDNRYPMIDKIEVYLPVEFCRDDIVIIDTPGLDAPKPAILPDWNQTLSLIDVVIMMMDISNLITNLDREFLSLLHDSEVEIFFAVTVSHLLRQNEKKVLKKFVLEELSQYTIGGESRIFFLSRFDALAGRLKGDHEMLARSRLIEFEEQLLQYIAIERKIIKLRRIFQQMTNVANNAREKIADKDLTNGLDSTELATINQNLKTIEYMSQWSLYNANNNKYKSNYEVFELLLELQDVLRRLGLKQEYRNIGNQIANLDSGELRILVSGQFNSGKTTLVSTFLGNDILPRKSTPSTGVITEIKWGDSEQVIVHFENEEDSPREISISELEDFSTLDIRLFSGARNQDAVEDNRKPMIDKIEIFLPVEFCRDDIVIIDTPGLNATSESPDWNRILPLTDVVIMVMDVHGLGSRLDREFLTLLHDSKVETLIVISKWDILGKQKEKEQFKVFASDMISQFLSGGDSRIFFLSGLEALNGRLKSDHEMLARSGLVEFEEQLLLIAKERKIKKLRRIFQQITNVVNNAHEKIVDRDITRGLDSTEVATIKQNLKTIEYKSKRLLLRANLIEKQRQ